MKHITDEKREAFDLLQRSRTIAVVGASPSGRRHSNTVATYLRACGYDVICVRPDRQDVGGMKSYASLDEVPGSVDLAIFYRDADEILPHLDEAARKRVGAVWFPPGAWSKASEDRAR